MKSKVLRILSIVMALVMIAGLAACGAAQEKPAAEAPAANAPAVADEATKAEETKAEETKQLEPVTVKLWTLWTESADDSNKKAFYRVLENVKKDHPNITIEHDATENEAYKTKLKTAIAANEAPDVFFAWGAGFVKPFVDAGKVLALDEFLNDGTKEKLAAGNTTNFTFNGKIYGLTAYQWVAALYCNKELFDQNSIKLPETYDDLLTAVKAFRAKGIEPITVGEKDRWPGMFWQNAFALRTATAQTCLDALAKTTSFDTPEFAESAAKLKELVDAKAFISGNMGLTYDEGNAAFLEGTVPMYYIGNWFAGNIQSDDSKVKDKVVALKFPALPGAKGDPNEFLGGSIDGFCVSNDTKVKDAAVLLAKYFPEQMAIDLNNSGEGLPTWNVPAATGEINPVTKQIMALTKDAKGYVLAWDTFLEGAEAETHKNLVAEIFGSKITPENFAKEMQKLNEKK